MHTSEKDNQTMRSNGAANLSCALAGTFRFRPRLLVTISLSISGKAWRSSITRSRLFPYYCRQTRSHIEANEAMPPPPRTSGATLSVKRIGNSRPGTHFDLRQRTVGTFAMHAILGHISVISIEVVNLRLLTSFTVDYSWKKICPPSPEKILPTRPP